MQKNV